MQLYNSLSKKIEPLVPLKKGKISMYACGLTPDGPMHLGHAATSIYNDVLLRYLMHEGYEISFVQNITDIDDDILKKSEKAGKTWNAFGDFWTDKFLTDVKKLGVLNDTDFKKATGSVPTMIKVITKLLEDGHAYESHGSIYYDVTSFPSFGSLSHFSEEVMLKIASERGGHVDDKNKKHPLDFVLWQKSKGNEPFWDSPFGKGRPGWHIECSSMILEFLGKQIDIHGGGKDLVFPHHESEIAQSEGFSGEKPFVGQWFHTAMVMYEGEKMSKSLGNLILVSDLYKKYTANEIKYYILKHHYRFPWEYSEEEMEDSALEWKTIEKTLKKVKSEKKEMLLSAFMQEMERDMCTTHALLVLKTALEEKSASVEFIRNAFEIMGFTL